MKNITVCYIKDKIIWKSNGQYRKMLQNGEIIHFQEYLDMCFVSLEVETPIKLIIRNIISPVRKINFNYLTRFWGNYHYFQYRLSKDELGLLRNLFNTFLSHFHRVKLQN